MTGEREPFMLAACAEMIARDRPAAGRVPPLTGLDVQVEISPAS